MCFGSVLAAQLSVPSVPAEVGWGVGLGIGGRFRWPVSGGRFGGQGGCQAGGRPSGGVVPCAMS